MTWRKPKETMEIGSGSASNATMKFKTLAKVTRIRSETNLQRIRNLPCAVCSHPAPSDPDHFRTRGAGGDDSLSNLNPLCRLHHQEKGTLGIETFIKFYGQRIEEFRGAFGLPKLEIP
jgi:hypothetical protein